MGYPTLTKNKINKLLRPKNNSYLLSCSSSFSFLPQFCVYILYGNVQSCMSASMSALHLCLFVEASSQPCIIPKEPFVLFPGRGFLSTLELTDLEPAS